MCSLLYFALWEEQFVWPYGEPWKTINWNSSYQLPHSNFCQKNPPMVAWFVRASVSHSVDSALDRMVDWIPLGTYVYMMETMTKRLLKLCVVELVLYNLVKNKHIKLAIKSHQHKKKLLSKDDRCKLVEWTFSSQLFLYEPILGPMQTYWEGIRMCFGVERISIKRASRKKVWEIYS